MKIYASTLFLSALSMCSCRHSSLDKRAVPKNHVAAKTTKKLVTPVWGYRFVITGDFTGHGKIDTFREHFYSSLTRKETNKFYENIDYNAAVDSVRKKKAYCFLSCSNKLIKALMIDSSDANFGLAYLKNEGDLDGDGKDEMSFVENYADRSSVNFCSVISYKKGKWIRICVFEMRDWELPSLPEANYEYWPFGVYNVVVDDKADSTNRALKKKLHDFPGLIKKLSAHRVQIHTFNQISDDTTISVNLASPGHKNTIPDINQHAAIDFNPLFQSKKRIQKPKVRLMFLTIYLF